MSTVSQMQDETVYIEDNILPEAFKKVLLNSIPALQTSESASSDTKREEAQNNIENSERICTSSERTDERKIFCSEDSDPQTKFNSLFFPANCTKKQFACSICSSSFRRRFHLQTHLFTHTKEMPYKCHICSYGSITLWSLKNHLLNHTEEKPFKCGICSRAFKSESYLRRHAISHSEERPFKCDICLGTFRRGQTLRRHKLLHNVEMRLYKCEVCSFVCNRRENLKQHLITHARNKTQ